MAITKKHEAVQAEKAAVRKLINAEILAGIEATKRVPKDVVNGSHGVAVAWKELAEIFVGVSPANEGPKRASVEELKARLLWLQSQVGMLCGKIPLKL